MGWADPVSSEKSIRQQSAEELLRRRRAREGLIEFTQFVRPQYNPGHPHWLIAEKLHGVLTGKIKRLMIFMPPRHGKSELGSRTFPALYLGRYPKAEVMSASYGADLADDFGRDVRGIVASGRYQALFPNVTLAEDSRARGYWHTNHGGSYLAAAIGAAAGGGSGITGRGADLLTIDDPHKDRSSAESPTIRNHVWNWYTSTAYTRLMPNAAIILIQTRWHEDDLAGRLLSDMENGGEKWEKLELSAVGPNNEIVPVWPERYDMEALIRIQTALGGPNSRDWLALYGQHPAPTSGSLFKVSQIETIPAAPLGNTVRAWDLAATRESGTRDPSWTVGLKLIITPEKRLVIADVVRFRGGPEEVERAILRTAQQDGRAVRIGLPQDPGQAGKAQVLNLTKMLFGFQVESSPENGDKATRAAPIIAQANVGNLAMVTAPWNRQVIEEMAVFPNGAHEDTVDALSRASMMLLGKRSHAELLAALGAMS